MDIARQADGTFMVAGRRFPNQYEAEEYRETLQARQGPPLAPAVVEPPGIGVFVAIVGVPLVALLVGLALSGAGAAGLGAIIVIVGGIAFYVSPAWVAHKAQHPQRTAITILNILLGWTVIGWIVCIVWAFGRNRQPDLAPTRAAPPLPSTPTKVATDRAAESVVAAEKVCPFCAEVIKAAAIKCKHCGSDLPATPTTGEAGRA